MSKLVKISIVLKGSTLRRIDRVAKTAGKSRSAMIDLLCLDALSQNESVFKAMGDQQVMRAFMGAMAQPGVLNAMVKAMGSELSDKQQQTVMEFLTAKGPPAAE